MREELNGAYRQLRELLTTFRLQLTEPGLLAALQSTVAEFNPKLGLTISLDYQLGPRTVPAYQAIHLLQIAREALSNILKHAAASEVSIQVINKRGEVTLSVCDNGRGLPAETYRPDHYGLIIMRDRAKSLHGRCDIYRAAAAAPRCGSASRRITTPSTNGDTMTTETAATILLIDDHPMLRNGVKQLIGMDARLQVIAEASNGEQGVALAEQHDPDLILLDLNMPGINGLETLDRLRQTDLSGRIVVFSVSNHEDDVVSALKRGADGYLLKDMEPEDLLKALHQAAAGQMVLSETLTPILAASLRENRPSAERDIQQLTPRERDILKLIAQGLPNKLIARRLTITESTVKVRQTPAEKDEAEIPRRGRRVGVAG